MTAAEPATTPYDDPFSHRLDNSAGRPAPSPTRQRSADASVESHYAATSITAGPKLGPYSSNASVISTDSIMLSDVPYVTEKFSSQPGEMRRKSRFSRFTALGNGTASRRDEKKPSSAWLAKQHAAARRARFTCLSLGLLIILLIVAGAVTAWYFVSRNNSAAATSGSSAAAGSSTANSTGVVQSDPNDPSIFTKDPRLHPSFWGMAYTPLNAQLPWCGATLGNVTEDIQLLSQLTSRIRMYGSDCNQTNLVLQAIQDTKVNMTVWLGIYIDNNSSTYDRQKQATLSALQTYGTDHVSGVIVGNEYILDNSNTSDPASATAAIAYVSANMADFRTSVNALNLAKTIPVGTADAGEAITTSLATAADFIMANVHPFFGGLPIAQAANWTWDYFETNDYAAAQAAPNTPPAYIAETGWPTDAMTPQTMTDGAAVAGLSELQTFLDTFVCQANQNGTEYFYFELFDEPWKAQFGGVEPYWGLMDANKVLKNITIPNCPI